MRQILARSAFGCALALGMLVSNGWSEDAKTPLDVVTVSASDSDSKVELLVGQALRVRLPAQLGAGFSWQVDSDSTDALTPLTSNFESSTSRPGAPEIQNLVLKARHAGQGSLKLHYGRPWEKDVPPAKTFVLHVTVHANK